MKKLIAIALISLFIYYAGYQNRFYIYSLITNINGIIEISDDISKSIKPNSILYIMVRNDKNIIFAVKEIINPQFPLKFKITGKNVLYSDISSFKIKIETNINTHGEVGKIKPGDFYSSDIDATIFSRNINIKINKIKN